MKYLAILHSNSCNKVYIYFVSYIVLHMGIYRLIDCGGMVVGEGGWGTFVTFIQG